MDESHGLFFALKLWKITGKALKVLLLLYNKEMR